MFNNDELTGKWTEIKGEIRKKWGQLTENELETTKGNAESLIGLVQQKLGVKKEEAQKHLTDLAGTWRGIAEDAASKMSNAANKKIDDTKTSLKH
jgi:uncharacterized protein YjbJ (UPF0337 family)